ncbi:hypothetical protein [Desulfovirgula thermocuniculi]|uniref:hypothetical protein n=1 Tax=Desulfovirgula thermocuniculi TaxID=348842 RepID=UPI00040BC8AC|nr:hypothetical protein [Desulfovirgula thermocuniculi]
MLRAWLFLETTRWYDGLPCVQVFFSEEPPIVEGCRLAGRIELTGSGVQASLWPPRLTPLQRRVWDAVVGWAIEELQKKVGGYESVVTTAPCYGEMQV